MLIRRYSFIFLVLSAALILRCGYAQASGPISQFQEVQAIPTSGAVDWEFFNIGADYYLAVTNYYNGSTHNLDSKIYKWNGSSFVEFQAISTSGATTWEFFTIGSDYYLAVTNSLDDFTYSVNAKIYKWNGSSFGEIQTIPANGGYDTEFFTIGTDHYLALTNHRTDATFNVDSKIYKWNSSSFIEYQTIPTIGATRSEVFSIGTDYYWAVANLYDGSTGNLGSKIYKWNGSSMVEFQTLATNWAYDWEFFIMGSDYYLAVANFSNGTTNNVDSKIYKWNGVSFVEYQTIPTSGAREWEFFVVGSTAYLALAQYHNDGTYNFDSKVYQWDGTNFVEFQAIPTHAGTSWESFTLNGNYYLVVSNLYDGSTFNTDSKIYIGLTPEIDVMDNGFSILDNTGPVNFGTTLVGTPITKTFTIQNLGTGDLTLTPPITLPVGYSLVNNFGTTTVTPTNSTTFTVQLDATTTGFFSGTLAFDNNDLDENPYNFIINGAANYAAYFPNFFKSYTLGSDLVVESIVVNPTQVIVVIKNVSPNVPANNSFRVDLYVDPGPVPSVVNQPWPDLSTEGLVWNVTQPIPPGGQLALTIDDPYYVAGLSSYSGAPTAGTPIYAQVDSVNLNTTYGSILESHEINGGVYNNITGTVAGP